MVLKALYKRTRTGAIQQWIISAVDGIIEKRAGQVAGKMTLHKEVCQPKNVGRANETTAQEQAELQAQSDWKKKRDEGYKSLVDLGTNVLFATNDVLLEFLEKTLPQFNTDANGNVKPMLAKEYVESKVKPPFLIQPKLDGARCLLISNSDGILFLTRQGKEYTTLQHIRESLINFFFDNPTFDNNFILDGEIYSDEMTFQEIMAACKKQRPESLKLKLRVYDTVNNDTQANRVIQYQNLVSAIGSEHITCVETLQAPNHAFAKECHDTWVKSGYEGAMIRLFHGTYDQGQRSSSLLKMKVFNDNEFEFLGFTTGQRDEDLIAICQIENGKEFRAKMEGNVAEKEALKKMYPLNVTVTGKPMMTIKHFSFTDDGLPRFPVGKAFRAD